MPNLRSAKKRMRQGEKRRLRNKAQRSTLRTALKRVHAAGTGAEAQDAFHPDASVSLQISNWARMVPLDFSSNQLENRRRKVFRDC